MRSALLALCCVCVAGLFALAIQALRAPPPSPAEASVSAPPDDARVAALERELVALRAEVDDLRQSPDPAPRASVGASEPAVAPAPSANVAADPAWYLREYERSFEGKPQGSDYFRLAVEAWVVELAPDIARRLSDRDAVAGFRASLARMLGDKRLRGRAAVVDALFAALFDARPESLGVAALEALAVVGDAQTGLALEKAWTSLATPGLRERALAVILALARPDENRALARLFARATDAADRARIAARVRPDAEASALELLRPASTDEEVVRSAAAEALRDLRGAIFVAFVDEWLGYERSEPVRRILGASRAQMTSIPSYAPEKATGAPDAEPTQDHPNAWASARADMGQQWLEVGFAPARRANALRVHEVCVAGALVRAIAIDAAGGEHVLWSGGDPTTQPGVFEITFATTSYAVARVRLVLDTDRAPGWSEIDAVQLVGPDGAAWASSATASSSFGQR